MNSHSDFFRASYDANYVAFFVYLAHLFDKRPDSSSIPTYFSAAASIIDPTELQILQEHYLPLAERGVPLVTVRHKTVAHIDTCLSEDDVFSPLNITWKQVQEVVYDSAAFVARLAGTNDPGSIGICRDGQRGSST
jgi:hypothetical protein